VPCTITQLLLEEQIRELGNNELMNIPVLEVGLCVYDVQNEITDLKIVQTRTSGYTRHGIRCIGQVRIHVPVDRLYTL
jgi:hypothetical protein